MFEILAVVTPFTIFGFAILALVFLFLILPKIMGSKKIDKLTQDLSTDTTSKIIDKLDNAKDGLVSKSKEAAKTIKDATKENKVINKALGRDTDKTD